MFYNPIVARVGQLLLEGGHLTFPQLLERMAQTPEAALLHKETLSQSRKLTEVAEQHVSERMAIAKSLTHVLQFMAERRLLNWRPLAGDKSPQFALHVHNVLVRLRCPRYIQLLSLQGDQRAVLERLALEGHVGDAGNPWHGDEGAAAEYLEGRGWLERRGAEGAPYALNEQALELRCWFEQVAQLLGQRFGVGHQQVLAVVGRALNYQLTTALPKALTKAAARLQLALTHPRTVAALAHLLRAGVLEGAWSAGLRVVPHVASRLAGLQLLDRLLDDCYQHDLPRRIVGVLGAKHFMEERDVAKLLLTTEKEVKHHLVHLLRDGIVTMQEISKAADHTVLRTFYLYAFEPSHALRALHLRLCHALQNLLVRAGALHAQLPRAQEENRRLLLRQRDLLLQHVHLLLDDLSLLESPFHSLLVPIAPAKPKRGKKKLQKTEQAEDSEPDSANLT